MQLHNIRQDQGFIMSDRGIERSTFLEATLLKLGLVDEETLANINDKFTIMDADRTGFIEEEELVIEMAFSLFDGDATNYLDRNQFAALCSHIASHRGYHQMGTVIKDLADCQKLDKEFDLWTSGGGKMSRNLFLRWWKSMTHGAVGDLRPIKKASLLCWDYVINTVTRMEFSALVLEKVVEAEKKGGDDTDGDTNRTACESEHGTVGGGDGGDGGDGGGDADRGGGGESRQNQPQLPQPAPVPQSTSSLRSPRRSKASKQLDVDAVLQRHHSKSPHCTKRFRTVEEACAFLGIPCVDENNESFAFFRALKESGQPVEKKNAVDATSSSKWTVKVCLTYVTILPAFY